jgi:pSer/pThr/pTyr-binding forkhead associated (FHA) protein
VAKILLKFNAAVIKEIPLEKNEYTIGRKPDNDIVIDNPAVSGHHARIVKVAGAWVVEDLNSTNGTFLRQQKLLKANLKHRDEVGVAKHTLVYVNEEEASAPPAAPMPAVSSDATVVISAPQAPAAAKEQKKAAETVGGLRVVGGETTASQFSLTGLTTYIGKSEQAAIRIKGLFAPDLAACVARKPEGYFLKVIKEKSVKFNGQVLADGSFIKEGDLIEVGSLKLVFYHQDAEGPLSG